MSEEYMPGLMPVLALRGLAVFPDQTVHFDIGRLKSTRAIDAALKNDSSLLLVPQKNIADDDPDAAGLYPIGTVVKVKQILKPQGDNLRVLVTGLYRAKLIELTQNEPYLSGSVEKIEEISTDDDLRTRALRREAVSLYSEYQDQLENMPQGVLMSIYGSSNTGFVADSIAQNSGIDFPDKAKLLCQLNPVRRLESAVRLLRRRHCWIIGEWLPLTAPT